MFRKIRSNRDPRDTVHSELKRELSPYLRKARNGVVNIANHHPKLIFWMMVINIVLSAVLSLTVFRHEDSPATLKKPVKILAPVSGGVDGIMEASRAIGEMLRLKKAIDSFSAIKKMNAQDSGRLEQALDHFQQLNTKFNQRKK